MGASERAPLSGSRRSYVASVVELFCFFVARCAYAGGLHTLWSDGLKFWASLLSLSHGLRTTIMGWVFDEVGRTMCSKGENTSLFLRQVKKPLWPNARP